MEEYICNLGVKMSIKDRIINIIVEKLNIKSKDVTPDSSFIDDLGADSLDLVELIMSIEDEFNIEFSDEDADRIVTVQDVFDYVKSY